PRGRDQKTQTLPRVAARSPRGYTPRPRWGQTPRARAPRNYARLREPFAVVHSQLTGLCFANRQPPRRCARPPATVWHPYGMVTRTYGFIWPSYLFACHAELKFSAALGHFEFKAAGLRRLVLAIEAQRWWTP